MNLKTLKVWWLIDLGAFGYRNCDFIFALQGEMSEIDEIIKYEIGKDLRRSRQRNCSIYQHQQERIVR